jgi:cytosine deaminase
LDPFLKIAYEEAMKGQNEGGIPIGSVLVVDGKVVGRGHNQRVQKGSAILHAEMAALEDAGRLTACDYQHSVLYTTLSPCNMCSGAILLYKIPKVIIGENLTFQGNEGYLDKNGVEISVLNDPTCIRMMEDFISDHPALWNEDIGEKSHPGIDC